MSVTRTGQSRPNVGAAPGRSAIGGRLAGSLALRRPFAAGTVDYKARKAPYVAAKAVGSFVPGLTRKSFEKYGFATAQLITDWSQVAGVEVARYTCPERIRWPRLPMGEVGTEGSGRGGATLILRVDPARALDIEYKRAQLMERINVYFGYRAVSDIRIVQGVIDAPTSAPSPAGRRTPPLGGTQSPAPKHTAQPTAPAIDSVDDESLRQALARMQVSIQSKPSRT